MRFLIWHIPTPGTPTPVYYIDRPSEPAALRIYAERSPDAGDLKIDILDDGVSIMNSNDYQKQEITLKQGYIEFNSPSGTFTANDTITGGTSGATARVGENKNGKLTLIMDTPSATSFSVGETITGSSSSATGVVNAYVRQIRNIPITTVAGKSHAILTKNTNSESAAQDFKYGAEIAEGSWLSLNPLDLAGASNVTVQLDLKELGESVESRP